VGAVAEAKGGKRRKKEEEEKKKKKNIHFRSWVVASTRVNS
jgi:hypothetical protein